MKGIAAVFFLPCRKASEYVERNLHRQLGWLGRLQLRAHHSICKACRKYSEQSIAIENLLSRQAPPASSVSPDELEKWRVAILNRTTKSG